MSESERGIYVVSCDNEDCEILARFDDTDEEMFHEPWAREQAEKEVADHPCDSASVEKIS